MDIINLIKKHKKKSIGIGVGLILLLIAGKGITANKLGPISANWYGQYNAEKGVAIKGYDPMCYYLQNKAIKGNPEIGLKWMGRQWHFSSEENKILFARSPEKYATNYGGFCSFGVGLGITLDGDPEVWQLMDNKVHFFFNQGAKDDFLKSLSNSYRAKVNANWEKR